MVLDWVKTVTEDQNITLEDLCQKVRILNGFSINALKIASFRFF